MAVTRSIVKQTMRIYSQRLNAHQLSRQFTHGAALSIEASSTVPRVASSSFWHLIIPKAFRQPNDPVSIAERAKAKAAKSKDWNPATFFIAMAVLIGSNAIQAIALRNERLTFTRKTDAKLALLRETIERVRSGEDINVEKVMGTGDPEKEKDWEEVVKELERDDALWQAKKKKRDQQAQQQQREAADALSPAQQTTPPPQVSSNDPSIDPTPRRPGFY